MKFKKICTKYLALTLCLTSATTLIPRNTYANNGINVNAGVDQLLSDESEVVEVVNNGYRATIKTVFVSESLITYEVNENGVQYQISYDLINENVTIDNNTYALSDFLLATDQQASGISNFRTNTTILDFIKDYKSIENANLTQQNIADNDTRSYPTTGYGQEHYGGTYKKLKMSYALTGAALTAIGAFIFKGEVKATKEFVTTVLKGAVYAGIIGSINDSVHGDSYYKKYQRFHNTTSAVKERRKPYTIIQGKHTFYGDNFYWYFWSQRPV
ncbi:MAG: hypothetical protein ACRCX2_06025 [Paraclostridium sp.]